MILVILALQEQYNHFTMYLNYSIPVFILEISLKRLNILLFWSMDFRHRGKIFHYSSDAYKLNTVAEYLLVEQTKA